MSGHEAFPLHVQQQRNPQRGATGILMAMALFSLLATVALVVDIGSGLVTKAELENVSDAGSLAGTRELAKVYETLGATTSYKDYTLSTTDKARIQAKIDSVAALNKAARVSMTVLSADVVYGVYDTTSHTVTPETKGVRAIQIESRRDSTANGVVPTTAARVLAIDSLSITATSAATLSPLGAVPPGTEQLPVGISSFWFDSHSCQSNNTIQFYPTGTATGCAGWDTFTDSPSNAAKLKNILNGLQDGSYTSPATTAGATSFNFTGGTVASAFPDMVALYDSKKDASGNWTVLIPVYQDTSCSNPTGSKPIVGFAKATINSVTSAPSKAMTAQVDCGITDIGAGNGNNDYGTLYGLPGMVE
ncbi:MAG TPA: pilus assembly protein TadG-related protein [Candidatus Binatia bacterium]